jgi:sulfite exporter TauE/SafE
MPEVTIITGLFLGFLLGVKHALDADHIVAVATVASRSNSLLHSALVGLSWGIGHTITLLIVGFVVLVFKLTIPDKLVLSMEFVVGVVLIVLGIPLVKQLVTGRIHVHPHQHKDKRHLHSHSHNDTPAHAHQHIRRPLLIGMVHGLAGSGALTILVLSTMPSVTRGITFVLVFGMGSIMSMLLFSGLIGLPFKFATKLSLRLNLWLRGTAGLISISLGFVIMWQTGFVAGLFLPTT